MKIKIEVDCSCLPQYIYFGGYYMSESVHLCLTDLLNEDLSSQEYFNTLPEKIRRELLSRDDITTFDELQRQAALLKSKSNENYDFT